MNTAYLQHLLLWMLPVVLIQWTVGRNILRANLRAIIWPTCIAGIYLTLADSFAIRAGVWFFDPEQILGWHLGPYIPIEEILFFILTSLIVTQSFILFLPNENRFTIDPFQKKP